MSSDDDLAHLLGEIRRRVLDAPPGAWDDEARQAGRDLAKGISERLRLLDDSVALAAVIGDPDTPEVFTVVAYRPDNPDLLAEQFPGRQVRPLGLDAFSWHVLAEVRRVLEIAAAARCPDTVVVGRTDGQGGWESWNFRFFAPKPGAAPELPDREMSQ